MELFELDINALSKGKKEAFFILYKKFFVALCLFCSEIFHWEGGSRRYCTRNII